jgi:hypothetical protein
MSADRFRRAALGLPEAVESSHGGHPDFRVGKRVFASLFYPDKNWGMVKLTPEQQAMVVDAEPEIFRPVRADGASTEIPMSGWRRPIPRRSKAR